MTDGETSPGIICKRLSLKELFANFFWKKIQQVGLVSLPALLVFLAGKEILTKNFLIELYKNLMVHVLPSDNGSTLEFDALTSLCPEIGMIIPNSILANHERKKFDMKDKKRK